MTVIAVQVLEDRVEFAADSQMTFGSRSSSDTDIVFTKLWAPQEGIVVGTAGTGREATMMQAYSKRVSLTHKDADGIIEWMVAFDQEYRDKTKYSTNNSYIFGIEGKVWQFHDFFLAPIQEYYAIGSGSNFALPAMMLGATAEDAVRAAIKFDIYCGGDIVRRTMMK